MSSLPGVSTFKVGLTAEEKELYSKLFKALDLENSGIVTGEKVRQTFEQSGLPPNILGEIWQLSDTQNLGFLTQFSFCHAMRLIGYTQSGQYPTAQLAQSPGPLPKFAKLSLPQNQLKPQSTSGSLLQTQPSALVPQNTATQQSLPQDPISPVSKADFEKFSQIYVRTTGSSTAPLGADAAKDILMKAKLPTVTLGQIWSLVDVKNEGALNLQSFVMAMHLIHGLLSGQLRQLPPFLPEHIWQSVRVAPENQRQVSLSSMSSLSSTIRHTPTQSQSEWRVSQTQKQQFDSIFASLDKGKTGFLASDQVASFLMTSRLDQQDLATIWDLSDIQNTGIFSKVEFGIALFLINRRRSGLSLPNVVPEELIDSLSLPTATVPNTTSNMAPNVGQNLGRNLSQSLGRNLSQSLNLAPKLAQSPEPAQRSASAQKSSLDDLVDIFGSGPKTDASELGGPPRPVLTQKTSSSDLTHNKPIERKISSTFRPTSSFGQSLLNKQSTNEADLIGEDVLSKSAGSPIRQPSIQKSAAPSPSEEPSEKPKAVDYEALRSVPAPPKSRSSVIHSSPLAQQQSNIGSENTLSLPENNDLLADSEVSGQLSEATSDIANFSNQIKSLSGQTSALHEKKLRAETELTRILAVKEEINLKLKLLRTSYANEVKQVEQVVLTLGNAKEETEALRSEASIAEAKFNNITNELHEKQLQVEDHQKTNSALREKLGNLNAENAELEKELEAKTAEAQRLSNDVNVRKSQVQVALVKVDELKGRVSDVETQHAKLLEEHENSAKELELHEANQKKLHEKHQELENKHRELSEKQEGLSKLVAGAAAAAVGGVAAGVGATYLTKEPSDEKELGAYKENESKEIESKETISKDVSHEASVPSAEFTESSKGANAISNEPDFSNVAVDAVANEFSSDMTGVDDASKGTDPTNEAFDKQLPDYKNEDMQELHSRFPDLSTEFNSREVDFEGANAQDFGTNRESASSVTESFKQTQISDSGATSVTSPPNSEYRFQTAQNGLVGGMAGIPGGLVGVQRTDSLTSSVQNNPSLSVRDDNIEEVSDRETASEEVAAPKGNLRLNYDASSERGSSGVGLFEIVNAEEAKAQEGEFKVRGFPTTQNAPKDVEEFPSPQELDFDDSSSSDSEIGGATEKFDDAVDDFGAVDNDTPEKDSDFDDLKPTVVDTDFDDLKPTVPESSAQDDFFGDEFDDLRVAKEDPSEAFEEQNVSMDDHFTGAHQYDHSSAPDFSSAPNFSSGPENVKSGETDEWEQLFAGFGNSTVQEPGNQHDLAVLELVAMGFEKSAVVAALEKENWNVDAATNYLLDTA